MAPGATSRSVRRPRPLAALLVLGLLVPLLTVTAARASTATLNFIVDQMADQLNPGACGVATPTGRCSLREAVVEVDQAAAAGPVQATITVPQGTYTFTRSKSATGADTATGGDLVISSNADVTIQGAGASATGTVIDAASIDRHFAVLQGGALTLGGLDLVHGQASSSHAGGSYPRGAGGSILVAGTLTVGGPGSGVLFDANVASGSGGAIEGVLSTSGITVTSSYFRNNTAADDGGAISTAHPVAAPGGSLGVSNTYFTGNQASGKHGTAGGGGAVIFGGPGYLFGSSVDSNTASGGGGGVVTSQGNALINDTIAHNTVAASGPGGGGVMTTAGGSVLMYSTVVGNTAPAGEATQVSTNAGIGLKDAYLDGASPLCSPSTPPQDLGSLVQTDATCDPSATVTAAPGGQLQPIPAAPYAPVAVQPHVNPPPAAARFIPLGTPECHPLATTQGITAVPFAVDADEIGNPRPNGTACGAGAIQLPDPAVSGTVLSWGNTASGELASSAVAGGKADGTVPVLSDLDGVPAGQSVTQVTGGQQDSFALTNQGQVYSWGSAAHLQTAHGGGTAAGLVPLPVSATAIAAFPNSFTGLAVGIDNRLYGWGDNSSGQIGTAGLGSDVAPQAIGGFPPGTAFSSVSVGAAHSLALTTGGTVYAWGTNTGGDLGPNAPTGTATGQVYPVPLGLAEGEAVAAVAAGQADSFALTTQGRIFAWGTNAGGELGTGSTTPASSATPVLVSLPTGVRATGVSSGAGFAEAMTPAAVYSWGSNDLGQLGTGNPAASDPAPAPVPLPAGATVESITNGANFALAHVLTPAGDGVLGWGFDTAGQLGNAATANSPVPVRTLLPAGVAIQAVAGAGFHGMAIVGPPGPGGSGGSGGPPSSGQATVTLSTAPTVPAGAQIVPEAAVTTTALPTTSTPSATAVASTALGSIALGSIALGSIALGSIALGSIALGSIALGSITLSQAPLNSSAGTTWAALLSCTGQPVGPGCSTADAGLPEQSLTLAQVVSLPQVQSLALGSIDLTNTALGSIALGSIALGSIALGSIPIPGPGPTPAANWCAIITAAGKSCAAGSPLDPSTATVLDLSLAGVPSSAIPWSSISLGGVLPALQANPQSSALGSIALGSIDLNSTALGSIALGSIALGSIALGSIALGSIALGSIALGSIPLTHIPPGDLAQLVPCSPGAPGNPCAGGTLGQIPPGAFLPGATLALLCSFPDTNGAASLCSEPAFQTTLAQLAAGGAAGLGGTTLLQLLEALPPAVLNSLLVSDVLTGLLPRASYPWQSVDLQAAHLQASAINGGIATYGVSLTVTGGPAAPVLTTTLPPDFVYRPGSTTLRGSALADPAINGSTLTWPLPSLPVGSSLVFQAFSALTLGTAAATATVTTPGQAAPPPSTASTNVTDAFAPGYRTPSRPQPLAANTLTLGYLGQPGVADWFSLAVNPGQELSISLSNLPADYDLTLYSPAAAPLRTAPVQNVPPVADPNTLDPPTAQTAPPVAAQDLGLTTQPVYALSDNRGTTNEVINTSPLPSGTYLVEVSGYNGATSPSPYLLRAQVLNTQGGPACVAPRTLGSQQPLIGMPSLPANVNTIFLANTERLAALYGAPTATSIVNAATAVANDGADGIVGAVIPVETTGTVAADYAAWDANRCSVAAANAVVSDIGGVVDTLRRARPSIRNVVILGDDSQIPSARVPDTTTLSNERGFAQDFTGPANELTAALAAGDLLTDAPYVNSTPLGVGSGSLFVPEIAIGRLVSTPTEIIGALNRFVSSHGGLNDTTGLSTGYDFLSDGAQSVAANLGLVPARQITQLVSNPTCTPQPPAVNGPAAGSTWPVGTCWTAANLQTALAANPNLASLNAHFDPSRLLPANGNQTGNQTSGLFTTGDLRTMFASTPGLLGGSLLFSMGCHAGLELPANEFGQSIDSWDQAFADEGAIWVANTGYGYGDTASVALSEQLMAGFAANLNESMTIGDALTYAKQTYAGGLAVVSPYDMKVLMESTFYGLPMYHLRATPAAPAPRRAGPPTTTDPLTGVTMAPESVSLGLGAGVGQLGLVNTPLGNYYQVNTAGAVTGSVQATEYRPLQPKLALDVTQPAPSGGGLATVAHGAVLTGLCSQDVLGFHPKIVRPVIDSSANEPPLTPADATFPSVLQSVTTFQAANGTHQQLVLVPGQFNSALNANQGTERLFTCLSANVLYANPTDTVAATDFTPPTIVSALGEIAGGVATFRVSVTAGVAAEPVKGVVVLYTSGGGVWQRANLVPGPGGTWTGGGPVSGTTLAWFVQAFDAAGNVAVASDKGDYFAATPSTPVAGSVVFGVPPVPASGFYTGPVPVSVTDTSGTPITYTLDGATVSGVPSGTVVTVSGPGVHQLSAFTGSGPPSSISIAIESGAPQAAISSPLPGAAYVINQPATTVFTCTDAFAVTRCSGTLDGTQAVTSGGGLPTSAAGTHTLAVTAVNAAGAVATASVTYSVGYQICNIQELGLNARAPVPVVLDVCDAGGTNLSAPGITVAAVTLDGRAAPNNVATGTLAFVLIPPVPPNFPPPQVATEPSYGYEMKGLDRGTHTLTFTAGADPTPHSLTFTLGP